MAFHDLPSNSDLVLLSLKPVTMADTATFVSPEPEPVSIVESVDIPPIESPVSKKPDKAVKSDSKPVVERQQGSLF